MIALRSAAPVNGAFGPEAGRPGAVCRHGRQFRQHRVDEGTDVGKSILRGRRRLGGVEGGAHMLRIRWLLAMT